jgi:hypothetical protein
MLQNCNESNPIHFLRLAWRQFWFQQMSKLSMIEAFSIASHLNRLQQKLDENCNELDLLHFMRRDWGEFWFQWVSKFLVVDAFPIAIHLNRLHLKSVENCVMLRVVHSSDRLVLAWSGCQGAFLGCVGIMVHCRPFHESIFMFSDLSSTIERYFPSFFERLGRIWLPRQVPSREIFNTSRTLGWNLFPNCDRIQAKVAVPRGPSNGSGIWDGIRALSRPIS